MAETSWRTVHVFLSSTFNDMHAERDYLVKRVFPRLRDWCERRRLRLVDIDLRWGVTEADATRHRRVVEVCLNRIDDCRPFFVCLIGQRYGWIPTADDVPEETLRRFPGLREAIDDGRSVTDLEVMHALLRPFHAEGSREERTLPAEHAFFYLRDPSCLAALPTDPPPLRRIYTDEAEADERSRAFLLDKLTALRKTIAEMTNRPARRYEARWDATARTPELDLPLECPSRAPENIERWRRQWREWAGVGTANERVAPGDREKALVFNHKLAAGRLTDFRCEGKPLGDILFDDLRGAIEARHPDHREISDLSYLWQAEEEQELFVEAAAEGFVQRPGDFSPLDEYVKSPSNNWLVLFAPSGAGKSTVLANWVLRRQRQPRDWEALVYRFFGVGRHAGTVDELIRSLLIELKTKRKLPMDRTIPGDPSRLREELPNLLAECGRHGDTILVLDAIDQLQADLAEPDWLPRPLPSGVKVLAGCDFEDPDGDGFAARLFRDRYVTSAAVQPFRALDDRRSLVRAFLSRHLKELDDEHLKFLVTAKGAALPLFLKAVLADLRVFGSFGQLGDRIRTAYGDTPRSAFSALLRRLEGDSAGSTLPPRQAAPRVFGLLAHSRGGLPEDLLAHLIVEDLGWSATPQALTLAAETTQQLLRQVRPFLARREGRTDYLHESFRAAAHARYDSANADADDLARSPAAWHDLLARGCHRWAAFEGPARQYAIENFAHHDRAAGKGERAAEALCDYRCLHARLQRERRPTEWQRLFVSETAGGHWAHVGNESRSALGGVIKDLAALADSAVLPAVREGLLSWRRFLEEDAHVLVRDAPALQPELILFQRAVAQPSDGPVGRAARKWLARYGPELHWLRRLGPVGRAAPSPACLRTMEGHHSHITAVVSHPDGRRAVSGSADRTLKVWDLDAGCSLRTLGEHPDEVAAVVLHPDGRRLLSGGGVPLKVWDLETGKCLRSIDCHWPWITTIALCRDGRRAVTGAHDTLLDIVDLETGARLKTICCGDSKINAVALLPDGRRAVTGSLNHKLQVWDLESGACLRTLEAHSHSVNVVAVHPDGRRAISGGDTTLKIWDLETGDCLRTLRGHDGWILALAMQPDGRLALSGSSDATLRLWDFETGDCRRILTGHGDPVHAVALDPVRRRAVSGAGTTGGAGSLKVWDLETEVQLRAPSGHRSRVAAVALSPDGRRAVTGSDDQTIKIWDVPSGSCRQTLQGHAAKISSIVLLDNGRRAMSISEDETLKVWDLQTAACLLTLERVSAATPSPDGRLLAAGAPDHALQIWDLETLSLQQLLAGHRDRIVTIAVDRLARRAVSASDDQTLRFWNLQSGRCIRTTREHAAYIDTVTMHPCRELVVSVAGRESIKCWSLFGECLRTLPNQSSRGPDLVVLGRHGERVISTEVKGDNHLVTVRDLANPEHFSSLALGDRVLTVVHRRDHPWVISSSYGATVIIWDLVAGDCHAQWAADGEVACAAASETHVALGMASGEVVFLELMPPGPWRPAAGGGE